MMLTFKNTVLSPPDCNDCNRYKCTGGTYRIKFRRYWNKNFVCPGRIPPKSGFKLIDIAMGHSSFSTVLPEVTKMVWA